MATTGSMSVGRVVLWVLAALVLVMAGLAAALIYPGAPSAARSAISFCRPRARTSCKLAMFAQTISNTKTAAAINNRSIIA